MEDVEGLTAEIEAQFPNAQGQLERIRLVTPFVIELASRDLSTGFTAEIEEAVRALGQSLPGPMTLDEHNQIGLFTMELVNDLVDPVFNTLLVAHLRDAMPTPSDVEDSLQIVAAAMQGLANGPITGPVWIEHSAGNTFPGWFEPRLLSEREPVEAKPFYSSDIEGYEQLNTVRSYERELFFLKFLLDEAVDRYFGMICDTQAPGTSGDEIKEQVLRDFQLIAEKSNEIHFFEIEPLTLERIPELVNDLAEQQASLREIRQGIYTAEQYLIAREATILSSDHKFGAYASRFERAKVRKALQRLLEWSKSPEMDIDCSQDVLKRFDANLPSLPVQENAEHDTCCVCHEDMSEDDPRLVVNYQCCKQSHHSDCLLEWMFRHTDKFTCPTCRKELDKEFFGEVLEIETRKIDVL